ncbi:MAG: hypothetical protein M5R38_07455 [Candidatus Methylomirabilis sp.]|nr:hypothetical protein [Candidatus Methylomirabilis sp.]
MSWVGDVRMSPTSFKRGRWLAERRTHKGGSGRPDLIEWYENTKPVKRHQDTRRQGKTDVVTYFHDGAIQRQEVDTKYEGRYDLIRFF